MSESHRKLLPWVGLATLYVVWGSTYMAIRLVVDEMPPFAAAGLRFLSAGIVMAVLAAALERTRPSRRQLLDNALVGVLLLGVSNALVMWSETRIPSGLAALLVAIVPLWLTLFEGLKPNGRWTLRGWAATVIGLIGVAVLVQPNGAPAPGRTLGMVALVVATLSWSIGALYSQSRTDRPGIMTTAAIQMLAGGTAQIGEAVLFREDWTLFLVASSRAWLSVAYLSVFGSIVGYTAFAYCLKHLPATTVGTYAYVNPVVALILGALFLGEKLSLLMLVGGAFVIASVVLSTWTPAPRPA